MTNAYEPFKAVAMWSNLQNLELILSGSNVNRVIMTTQSSQCINKLYFLMILKFSLMKISYFREKCHYNYMYVANTIYIWQDCIVIMYMHILKCCVGKNVVLRVNCVC